MNSPVLLLTATIAPGQTINTMRADPHARLQDYRRALEHWLIHGPCAHIVLCESSAASVSSFAAQMELAARLGRTVEFHSFQQDFDPVLGKGFGEVGIIEHALGVSPLLSNASMILKATGRYIVRNAALLADQAAIGEADIICDLREYLTMADCRWFAATPEFFRRHLIPRRAACDDRRGVFLEHVLAQATHSALAAGLSWRLPHAAPTIDGVGETNNRSLRTSMSKRLRLWGKRRLLKH
jgi:hypothetical protein